MNREQYEAKRQARYERLLAAAERAEREGSALVNQARDMASIIPFGQPILVGHYSEGRDRRYRGRIENKFRKGYELHQRAEELRSRAKAAANNHAISGDDPDAIDKIKARIAKLERDQELMIAANKAIRAFNRHPEAPGARAKLDEACAKLGMTQSHVDHLLQPDFCGRIGFPDYATSNNNANIHRLKDRLKVLEQKATTAAVLATEGKQEKEETIGAVRIVENYDANRLQIFFPGKPDASIRQQLKAHGFRWAPTEGAWQAYLSNGAIYWARQIVGA